MPLVKPQTVEPGNKGGPRILAHFHDARMAARGPDYFELQQLWRVVGDAERDLTLEFVGVPRERRFRQGGVCGTVLAARGGGDGVSPPMTCSTRLSISATSNGLVR